MSYQYYDQAGAYGIPNYPGEPPRQRQMAPPQGRRPSPGYQGQSRQPGPPPMRPDYPPAQPSAKRFPVRPQHPPQPPQPQQYAQPPPRPRDTENLYDGSAYGEPEIEQNDQWPLPSRPFVEPVRGSSPGGSPRRAPQRPPRPDQQQPPPDPPRQTARVSPANEQHQVRAPQQSYHGSGQWTGDGYSSAQPRNPPVGTQRPAAPIGPDPQQQYQQGAYGQANKRPPLGPPPSSRRGPASYYAQVAPVHPIVEETDSVRGSVRGGSSHGGGHESMKSYASSNAIPIGIPDYYLQQRDSVPSIPDPPSEYGDDSPMHSPKRDFDERRMPEEREEPSPEPATIMRQASLGRKSKPKLTTVKSTDRVRKDSTGDGLSSLPSQQRDVTPRPPITAEMAKEAGLAKELGMQTSDSDLDSYRDARAEQSGHSDKELEAGGAAALAAAVAAKSAHGKVKNDSKQARHSPQTPSSGVLSSGTGLIDPSSSESEKSTKKRSSKELLGAGMAKGQRQPSRDRSPLAREVDPRVASILGGLEKGGALSSREAEELKTPTGGLSERAGKRRPPRLNVDAVKEAEARGSLTSLPDLIKRATRVASNLDRGKTASRLGMNWFDGAESGDEKHNSMSDKRRSGSISDMLASFPPPGLATPPGSRHEMRRSMTNWSSNLQHSHLPSDSDAGELRAQKRKCCGMPVWLFLLLLVVLILLVAAAIIVPVMLVVVPRQRSGGASNAASTCQSQLSCQNGGASIVGSDGGCRCVCVNGYTGSTCGVNSQAGCTTTSVGTTDDATVGSAIPRLLIGAQSNFSIPLDGQTILGLFSSSNMSCNSENALVTLNSNAERSLPLLEVRMDPSPTVIPRAASTTSSDDGAATSGGIVFETGSPTANGGSSATSSSSPSSSSGSGSSNSTSSTPDSSTTDIDFARVAILYILQSSGQLGSAVTAQETFQQYFTSGQTDAGQNINAKNISLGNGVSCDLSSHRIALANGTITGGSSSGSGSDSG